jgi:hypothetical protein
MDIDALIAKRKREIELLEALRGVEDDPELRKLAVGVLGSSSAAPVRGTSAPQGATPRRTVDGSLTAHKPLGQAVVDVMSLEPERYFTIKELAKATGRTEGTIRQILYRAHAHRFVKREKPGTRYMEFSLKEKHERQVPDAH